MESKLIKATVLPKKPKTSVCLTCKSTLVLARSGWVTGHSGGWILPSHLNSTCDGIHLHSPADNERLI